MKFIFLNVWYGSTGEAIRDFLKNEIKTTDVFCFMEADGRFKEIAKDILVNYEWVSKEGAVVNEFGAFQSTCVKKGLKFDGVETIFEDKEELGLGLYTKLKVKKRIINLMNFHGVALPGTKLDNENRLKQSRGIIDFMAKVEGAKIIGGDFNLDINTESVRMFEKNGYRNLIREFGIKTTRNRLIWDRFPESIQMWADYLFVSPEIIVKSFEVPRNEVSDHLPLILEIEE